MANEPELKSSTKRRALSPLMVAWGIVLISLGLAVGWVILSEPPETVSDTPTTSSVATDEPSSDPAITDEPPAMSEPASTPVTETPANNPMLATQSPLPPVPNQNLLVAGDNGLKPALGPDGLVVWKEYARPFEGAEERPRIAILVTDVGLNSKSSQAAIDNLPGQVDLAFSPYGRNLQDWMDKSRNRGHEGFLMIPTEPLNYPDSDPGPHTLVADMSERENMSRLDWILSQVTGYVGVVNHMGSKFTASEEDMTPVITDLASRGLMLVDARSTRFSMAARLARRTGMPRAMNDRYIDNNLTPSNIQNELAELEKTANTFGAALGMARALPITINEIAEWSKTLEQKGIDLVPVTAIANRQPIK
ncbi:divergent polysaccharide deacetylase family protein [Pseudemcibacter aquimaris]|uniref:divergent polysaccharide deacetylase family protein n=1 Tax=Pseudemcibacter aquimaris TaxID=2857064 RepID=UPI002012F745|nr:divergent polysaccharide deacetylase family protein [Pseudemcibacter aquimaris]MCC3861639.1 divergent polysaccharide deacetylase family protein [Pseudemcibacter aquimaris]WDU58410.1 divergent polysaccharide deacetylase family protein [Pseudemcibacter aquimaris]